MAFNTEATMMAGLEAAATQQAVVLVLGGCVLAVLLLSLSVFAAGILRPSSVR
jgi:hypothetical protein